MVSHLAKSVSAGLSCKTKKSEFTVVWWDFRDVFHSQAFTRFENGELTCKHKLKKKMMRYCFLPSVSHASDFCSSLIV